MPAIQIEFSALKWFLIAPIRLFNSFQISWAQRLVQIIRTTMRHTKDFFPFPCCTSQFYSDTIYETYSDRHKKCFQRNETDIDTSLFLLSLRVFISLVIGKAFCLIIHLQAMYTASECIYNYQMNWHTLIIFIIIGDNTSNNNVMKFSPVDGISIW